MTTTRYEAMTGEANDSIPAQVTFAQAVAASTDMTDAAKAYWLAATCRHYERATVEACAAIDALRTAINVAWEQDETNVWSVELVMAGCDAIRAPLAALGAAPLGDDEEQAEYVARADREGEAVR